MILLTDEEIHIIADSVEAPFWHALIEAGGKAQLKKVVPILDEAIRLLGKVVPHDKNSMIEWAVKSQDAVYTNAGATYRILLEYRQSLLDEVKEA